MLVTLSLLGCTDAELTDGGDTSAEDPDTVEPGTPEPDPIAEALGGCTVLERYTQEHADDLVYETTFDANGDPTEVHDRDGWTSHRTYDAPHEVAVRTDTYADGSETVWRSTWAGGRLVRRTTDVGGVEAYGYDDRGLLAWSERDDDGDGELDDAATFAWASDGADGWSGASEGVAADTPYIEALHADALARIDERSLSIGDIVWSRRWSGFSAAGYVAHREEAWVNGGVTEHRDVLDNTIDAAGRPIATVEIDTFAQDDAPGGEAEIVTHGTWTWDCP